MAPAKDLIRVFVSSTAADLEDYRGVARHVIAEMQWHANMFETEMSGGRPEPTVEACRKLLETCDVVLVLVAFRRGWVPRIDQGGDGASSITALELKHARDRKIPVLLMLANGETWPAERHEDDAAAKAWIHNFRSELNQPAAFFDFESNERLLGFRARLLQVLLAHKERLLDERPFMASGPSQDDQRTFFDNARRGLLDGSTIPFVGPEVHCSGPLSSIALARALAPDHADDALSLATAAEYREAQEDSRAGFLDRFREVLEAQQREAAPTAVHEMVCAVAKPPLIISATCDQVLERGLERAGRSYATVTHIVRSFDGEHDGKILVIRGDRTEICLADKLPKLDDVECIVYKPLGSPFLHERLDAEAGIDTVVVTETDHMLFLMRLDNEHTQVPTIFTPKLRSRPLLFLGYTLDTWQYRLVMQIYQTLAIRRRSASTLAVREPGSPMEAGAWNRLGARLLRMSCDEFTSRIRSDVESRAQ